MLDQLRKGDMVVVWKLDRLSRSLKDVLHIMERIAQAGAAFGDAVVVWLRRDKFMNASRCLLPPLHRPIRHVPSESPPAP